MPTTADFLNYAQWVGFTTLACAAITVLAFILKWGIMFQLVGVTGLIGVVTGGLFALGLVPLTRTVIAGAVRFSVVYDTGGTQAVISVPPQISESELEATLRQAASNLYSFGRLGRGDDDQLTIRARTTIHPDSGVSQPLYLGKIRRSLSNRNDDQMAIEIYEEKLAQLPKSAA